MALTLDEFRERLVHSGIVTLEEVSELEDYTEVPESEDTVQVLARRLVNSGKITKYQAGRVYSGRGAGLILGNYVILDKIGQGGMGRVFKARHRRMKRLVALKELPASMTRSNRALKRFQREVEVAGQLDHPNIVTAFDADESSGSVFLVMEFVDGQNLAKLVDLHGPFSVEDAVHCILQSARGLQYAHQRGIIHRDIKPQNLLLDANGNVKILDMGLVRFARDANETVKDDALTKENQIVGTIDYMSPEQAEDTRHADARADVYSLGCTLFRILTGRTMYEGGSTMKRLLAHREQPNPSLCDEREEIPASLDAIFQKMVAKNADDRIQSMGELVVALEAIQETSGSILGLDETEREASPEDSALLRFVRTIDDQEANDLEQRVQVATDVALHAQSEADTKTSSLSGGSGSTPSATRSSEVSRRLNRKRITNQWRTPAISLIGFVVVVALVVWWITRPAYVVINWANPDWPSAVLLIDGKPYPPNGKLPPSKRPLQVPLDPGQHQIVLKHREHGSFSQSISLSGNAEIEIDVRWTIRPPMMQPDPVSDQQSKPGKNQKAKDKQPAAKQKAKDKQPAAKQKAKDKQPAAKQKAKDKQPAAKQKAKDKQSPPDAK